MPGKKPGKLTSVSTKTLREPTTDQKIKSQGLVQAVINSGAPISEWERRSRYAILLVNAFAATLAGNKVKFPALPLYARDPSAVCMGDEPDAGPFAEDDNIPF